MRYDHESLAFKSVFDHDEQVLFSSLYGGPLDPERRIFGEAEQVHWETLRLQAIQNSEENIMEKREEIADSGGDATSRIIERERFMFVFACLSR